MFIKQRSSDFSSIDQIGSFRVADSADGVRIMTTLERTPNCAETKHR